MSTKLETIGLAKTYRETPALLPTDLRVAAGEFLTLLGPSGSGKTTLLQMISGLVEPSAGQLLIDGRDATHDAPGKRGIGMVFQSYALFPHMTVWENVAYGLRMRKLPRAELAPAVDAALAMVKMQAFAQRLPSELSGGQQQRIALARCFAFRPSIILLDEPLGALDKKLREHMQLEIRRLHQELGATFIYVTHDQDEALTLSDRICLMNQARIEQIGTPAQLYDRPATRFAADFLGHSNLLDGVVERLPDGCVALRVGATEGATDGKHGANGGGHAGTRLVPIGPSPDLPAAGAASLLVRPEAARLTSPEDGALAGTIREVVFLGSDTRAIVSLGQGASGGGDGAADFTVRCPRELTPRVGDRVGLAWDHSRATLLTR
ncbi:MULTISPECIES: ABC transporter ATP-binding protein [Pandoraea]|uniref:ABC transporter ATP-binding protein n=1 Tax=Pandoraea TaxID=93217 RepID=UPI001F5DFC0E|nr:MULTISPECIES: ABC transporter ATP-binding protein [Pandoraea]MCI3208188.1 polyamine ABC transporter ATP-binding protein [Pandoraea sp. LA3]MDN4586217.1 polyamine ABC transporter ATP-binding protein [Pandoraea capi]